MDIDTLMALSVVVSVGAFSAVVIGLPLWGAYQSLRDWWEK